MNNNIDKFISEVEEATQSLTSKNLVLTPEELITQLESYRKFTLEVLNRINASLYKFYA